MPNQHGMCMIHLFCSKYLLLPGAVQVLHLSAVGWNPIVAGGHFKENIIGATNMSNQFVHLTSVVTWSRAISASFCCWMEFSCCWRASTLHAHSEVDAIFVDHLMGCTGWW